MAKKIRTSFEDAPPLVEQDFKAFEKFKWADSEFNAERLKLKRKLQAIGEPVFAYLKKQGAELTLRTSIHNPYVFNGHRVDALWFYLSPSDKAKKPIKDLLGVEFSSDTDASYVHANLIFQIRHEGMVMGLRVHERAWWDVQNAKGRCSERPGAEEFAARLNGVQGGYVLTLHDWKQEYPCGQLQWDDIVNYFRYCEPGSHRMLVTKTIPRESEEIHDPAFYRSVAEEFATLLPVYDFLLWSPENNYLGMGGR